MTASRNGTMGNGPRAGLGGRASVSQWTPFACVSTAIGRCIDAFTPLECANVFAAAGYDAT